MEFHACIPYGPALARVFVAIAASSGGIQALQILLRGLPHDLPAAVAIVQHRTADRPSALAEILGRATTLRVKDAFEGEPLCNGSVLIAPADRHMTIRPDRTVHLEAGRKIRYVRSSADPLFVSGARAFGPNMIAVVLTGGDSDGTDGVLSVTAGGGLAIAQDPATSACPQMPESAIGTGKIDRILAVWDIAKDVVHRARERAAVAR